MNKKIIISAIAIGIVAVVVFNSDSDVQSDNIVDNIASVDFGESEVKEFEMTSFTEIIDGKYYPQFSLKEITVNKGDTVRIKLTVTSGMHDFKIDEFDVYADTQLDQQYVIEFVADQVGEFVYYCTKTGHRENGHWGTLRVL